MWMQQRVMQRSPGREGVIVVLADVSGSIGHSEANMIKRACEELRPSHEGLRFFAWACEAIEVPWRKNLFGKAEYPDLYNTAFRDGRTIANLAGGGNDLHKVLQSIAPLNPAKTIILSDGYEGIGAPCRECLAIVDNMTGSVDAFCTSVNWAGPAVPRWNGADGPTFMAELARRGGGRFVDTHRCDLRVEMKRSIHVIHETQVHHHKLPPKHIHHWR